MELYEEKYRDVPAAERPAEDKQLWRQVMKGRNVGESRKQALGGLPPSFDKESSASSHYSRATSAYPPSQSQSFTQDSQIQQTMQLMVQTLASINTVLSERLPPRASEERSRLELISICFVWYLNILINTSKICRGKKTQVVEEDSDSEDLEFNLSDDTDAEYEEEEQMRERRMAHEEWDSRRSGKGKNPVSSSSKKKSGGGLISKMFRKKKK